MELNEFWAKTTPFQSVVTHGMISGRIAQHLAKNYLSAGTRKLLQTALNYKEEQLCAFLGYLVSLHDIGKIEYNFQCKDPGMREKLERDSSNKKLHVQNNVRHEITGRDFLGKYWQAMAEDEDSADLFSSVIGAHHPGRGGKTGYYPKSTWFEAQIEYENLMRKRFLENTNPVLPIVQEESTGTVGAVLLALLILADWISSGQTFADAEEWINNPDAEEKTAAIAERFLEKSGLGPKHITWPEGFCDVWPNIPATGRRPLQAETEKLFQNAAQPFSILLIEAPMGEGKTEAGVYAALQMAGQWKKDGFYLALPTAATSDQMVKRMRDMLSLHQLEERVRLLHAMAWLEQEAVFSQTQGDPDGIANWLQPIRRGLLGQYAVGTVDQAMLSATNVKYGALRLLGLSNKVLIIDEIHSYDAYMSRIIQRLLEWCKALEIPVVMLSATLPPEKKQELFKCYTQKPLSLDYPLITAIQPDGTVVEHVVSATTHSMRAAVAQMPYLNSPEKIAAAAMEMAADGGCLCVLMNTVKEAQSVYSEIKKNWDGDLLLFHAQFPAGRRAEIERECVYRYGKDKSKRPARSILVATQVVEQSLDVDFDAMLSAVAPIDLLLQRLGRVHRHSETRRPAALTRAFLGVLVPTDDKSFGSSAYVYPECLLKSAIRVLKSEIRIPEDIAPLVQKGYDPANVPPEEMEEWMENTIKEQVEAGASQQFLIHSPSRQYNALVDNLLYDDNAGVVAAATRLGEPTVRLAFLRPQEYDSLLPYRKKKNGTFVAEVWDKQAAERVMRQSVSVRVRRFRQWESFLTYINGDKLLSGTRIIRMENDRCPLEKGRWLCNDPELGIIIKEGEI